MKKSILNLKDVEVLTKQQKKTVTGGACYSFYITDADGNCYNKLPYGGLEQGTLIGGQCCS